MQTSGPFLIIGVLGLISAAAGDVFSHVNGIHWLLHASEELHRSFKLVHNVRVLNLQTVGDPPQLCAISSLASVTVSRRQFEESWTTVYSASSIVALFNGDCFAISPGTCADYTRCEEVEETYPEERDPESGLRRFKPELASLEALAWATGQAEVQSWQNEQAELLHQLQDSTQDSEEESYLRLRLMAAAGAVDLTLRTENHALAQIASVRAKVFRTSVEPSTSSVAKQSGAAALPQSFVTLAAAIQSVIHAVLEHPCSPDKDWMGLREQLSLRLQDQADAIDDVDSTSLLEPTKFDYAWRASEALIVGSALALQCAALSVLAEFECQLTTNPRSAQVSSQSVESLRKEAHELLQELSDALPEPTDVGATSAPLQRCFARRVVAARDAISVAAAGAGMLTPPLLSLDFCERLFQATVNQVIKVSPYTESPPPASDMQLFASSSEERSIHFDTSHQLAYVDPYARIVERPTAEDGTMFATGDKMIQLQPVEEVNVREASRMPSMIPCVEQNGQSIHSCNYQPPCQPGCYELGYGTMCAMADRGWYSEDGIQRLMCQGDQQHFLSAYFYMKGWHNNTCPFICKGADSYPQNGKCAGVDIGSYSPLCNNSMMSCATPTGMPLQLFHALVTFTSAGQGSPTGCEITLTFPLILAPPAVELTAPFTVELFVKLAVRDIPSSTNEHFAILAGVFPYWFVALRRASENSVQIAFYHAAITRAPSSRQDSLVDSETIPWTETWRHIAVVVSSTHTFEPNIKFYCDGSLVSSASRATTAVDVPPVPFSSFKVFHVGPPNMQLFPGVLAEGRREPYFNVSGRHLYYRGELDEVRVHSTALSGLALGVHLTELRQRVACNVPVETLQGATCRPAARLTAMHATADRTSCKQGFETCAAHPGMCVAQCKAGMLKTPDCTCECPSGQFQVWLLKGIQLRGSGSVRNITVFDAEHRVVAKVENAKLDRRVDLEIATRVAVITVRGGGSATAVSLYVETVDDEWLPVPAFQNVELLGDRDVILHHRRLHEFSDSSFECVDCPGHAIGSNLPRFDALACTCAEGYGRNLLGRCEARRGMLPSPLISPALEFHTAGTRVQLTMPSLDVEGPWLAEIRFELGIGRKPDAPSCTRSPKYMVDGSQGPGLDVIQRLRTVTLRAVLCHPLHYSSPVVERNFTGNDHLDPPMCSASGALSTQTSYALQVNVTLTVDNEPDARILYKLDGGAAADYQGPITISDRGVVVLKSWARKSGFDTSMMTTCRYRIDGAARVVTKLHWLDDSEPQIAGFLHEEQAFLVRRGLKELRCSLMPELPSNGSIAEPVDLQYRLLRKPLGAASADLEQVGDWQHIKKDAAVSLNLESLLWASHTTTLLRVEWKAQETGFVWSAPSFIQLVLLATRAKSPAIDVTPTEEWGMGDHWDIGPKRDAALRQVHNVEIRKPTPDAILIFTVGDTSPGDLIQPNAANASSIRNGGLVTRITITAWSHEWGPDELATGCGTGSDSLPRLCYYVGRFTALAGVTIQAFALQDGQLESEATVLRIAKQQDPGRGQAAFEAGVELVGPRFSLTSMTNVFVLPSDEDALEFSLGLDGLERQSCVLLSRFSYEALNSSSGVKDRQEQQFNDCQWLPYNGERMLQRDVMYEKLGVPISAATSLNVTVLTTVRRHGYLWAYPYAAHFLWLRDRTSGPSIIGVVAPGVVPTPAAMVWLQGLGADVSGAGTPSCYFSLSHIPISDTELELGWLQVVPELSASVSSIRDAMQPTDLLKKSKNSDAWSSDLTICVWPNLCELPLNGLLPAELIQAPAALPWVCGWAILPGYSESATKCTRIELSEVKFVRPAFTADMAANTSKVMQVGEDTQLGAIVVIIGSGTTDSSESARQLAASALTLSLDRSHPLQYRFASVAARPESLLAGASNLISEGSFSQWRDLGAADPSPEVPFPVPTKDWPAEHPFVAVDVRLMVGINSWSEQARSFCVALQGRHPALEVEQSNRTIMLKNAHKHNGTILYRWVAGGVEATTPLRTHEIYPLQTGFKLIQDAYKLEAGVKARLQPPGSSPQDCIAPTSIDTTGADELQAEATVGPRLCSLQTTADDTAAVQLSAPDGRRWALWAAVYSPGMAMSPPVTAIVEAQCVALTNVSHAETSLCLEGHHVDSGQVCRVQCRQGYTPSERTLRCKDGMFTPSVVTCNENPCTAIAGSAHAHEPPCAEGEHVLSGGVCTSLCKDGFVASVSSRLCERGAFLPANFTCVEAPCAAPLNIFQVANPSCTGLTSIASGEACIPQCQPGYIASEQSLQCSRGVLSPSSFQCNESPCVAPSGVRYASTPPCLEGQHISAQGTCRPRCQSGFAPSELLLTCSAGVLQPNTFACDEVPCIEPAGIANGHAPPCGEGQWIRPGDTCTARCSEGFAPTHSHLTCTNGSLVPPVFECKEKDADLYENILLISALVAVIALIGMCAVAGAIMWMRRHPIVNIHVDEEDPLDEWPNDVRAVAGGICVFCQANPVEVQGLETSQLPATIVKCCIQCAECLPLREIVTLDGAEASAGVCSMSMPTGSVIGTSLHDNMNSEQRASLLDSMPPSALDSDQSSTDVMKTVLGHSECGIPANFVQTYAAEDSVFGRTIESMTSQDEHGASAQIRSGQTQHTYPNLLITHDAHTISKKESSMSGSHRGNQYFIDAECSSNQSQPQLRGTTTHSKPAIDISHDSGEDRAVARLHSRSTDPSAFGPNFGNQFHTDIDCSSDQERLQQATTSTCANPACDLSHDSSDQGKPPRITKMSTESGSDFSGKNSDEKLPRGRGAKTASSRSGRNTGGHTSPPRSGSDRSQVRSSRSSHPRSRSQGGSNYNQSRSRASEMNFSPERDDHQ